jgi:histidinol-phosphatase
MLDPIMNVWDAAALKPIIDEAGGVFTSWDGAATHDGGSAVATNAALAREVRTLLNGG